MAVVCCLDSLWFRNTHSRNTVFAFYLLENIATHLCIFQAIHDISFVFVMA